ncbi:hypothetical protein HHI36_014590 [Cryptolaemus montrouzieri]|uniref:Pericentrin/AKAP-450 centrosomal targeting domain-containing protein n=1 Tax=Cryptolaemus montrouzieri TaxID=559131 RepID=A0ABD2N356_9CUCU
MITHLNGLVEEMRAKIEEKDSEISSTSEDEMIITMQKEIEHLRNQNELLHKRLTSGVDIIPNLVENIISDKNSDIESLKQKLESTEKQLELYSSLNLDKSQISAIKNLKNSGTSLSEVLSILELSSPEQARRMADSVVLDHQTFLGNREKKDDTIFLSSDHVEEISSIQKEGPSDDHFLGITPLGKKNFTEMKSSDKRVHFDLSHKEKSRTEMEYLISELEELKVELKKKEEIIRSCDDKLKTLTQLEANIDFVQGKLEETQNTLKEVTDKFEKEISTREENEKDLKMELIRKKLYLEEQEKELQLLRDDAVRKDEMYLGLAKESKNLKKENETLAHKVKEYQDIEDIIVVKNKIILELEEQIAEFRNKVSIEDRLKENEEERESLKLCLDSVSKENEEKNELIVKLETDNKKLTEVIMRESENNEKLRKNLENKERQIEECEKDINRLKRQIEILENEKCNLGELIKAQKKNIVEKERELEDVEEGTRRNSEGMRNLELEVEKIKTVTVKELEKTIFQLREENSSKTMEIEDLNNKLTALKKEQECLQGVIVEKNKIIAQFKKDSELLQVNLETIQNKMQESGNIIDLGRKLRDEQMKTTELMAEIQILKAQLMSCGILDKDVMVASIEDITGKVKEELAYSAKIDSNIMNVTDNEDADELQDALSRLKLKYNELNKKLLETQDTCRLLESDLEKKKFEFESNQLEDANLIEQLRIQLEYATENEVQLEKIVESWKKQCKGLEIEISKLKAQLSNVNSRTDSTEYKNLPTKDSQELLRLTNEILELNQEVNTCTDEIKSLKKAKKELETNLRYYKDMLDLKNREIGNLEKNIEENMKKEGVLIEKLTQTNEQLQKKSKEVENSRFAIDEMDQERKTMKKHLDQLNTELRILQEEKKKPTISRNVNTSLPIADQLMNKIEEINSSVKNDRRTMDLILRLTNDNKMLKNRILELETEGINNVPFENPMNRANYLFAKCLRVESYRKALIWQKRYLISLIGSYQSTTDLGPMEKLQGQKKIRFSGIRRFRCVVYGIIATLRMKFIVRRWHSGARLAENVNSRYRNVSVPSQRSDMSELSTRPGNFQVGQPVSHSQFTQSVFRHSENIHRCSDDLGNVLDNSDSRLNMEARSAEGVRDMPWSGASPPCREKSGCKPRLSSNVSLLKAPYLLNQYAERYNKIQENLEIMLKSEPST